MKKILIVVLLVIGLFSCTENSRSKNFGGTMRIYLPDNEMLINATWKESQLWYLTQKMPEGYQPTTKTFQEKSSLGVMEGKIIFYEKYVRDEQ